MMSNKRSESAASRAANNADPNNVSGHIKQVALG